MSGQCECHQYTIQCNDNIVRFTKNSIVRLMVEATHIFDKFCENQSIFMVKSVIIGCKFLSRNVQKYGRFSTKNHIESCAKICEKQLKNQIKIPSVSVIEKPTFNTCERSKTTSKTTSKTSSKVLENTFETTSKPLSKLFEKRLRNHLTGPFSRIGKPLTNPLETP